MTDPSTPATAPDQPPDQRSATAERVEQLSGLFRQHADGLAGAIRAVLGPRAEVADVLQEAFARVLSAVRRGASPADPVAWIFVVTMNLAKDLRRRRARRKDTETIEGVAMDGVETKNAAVGRAAEGPSPHERMEREEAVGAARDAIARLADGEKEVFLLRASAGLTFESAAQALGIPVGTAKTRMRAALIQLRGALARFAPEMPRAMTPPTMTPPARRTQP